MSEASRAGMPGLPPTASHPDEGALFDPVRRKGDSLMF